MIRGVRRDCTAWYPQGRYGGVVDGQDRPRASNMVGVLTKEHIADEVVNSVRIYPR